MSNFMKKNFYKQREYFEKSAAVRDKKFSFPDGVVESRDIPYIADGQKEHLMDVYRPQGKENETLPVIINIHGGGLLIGNKEFNRYFCARLCLLGYVVFSVEYRLVPDCSVYDQFSDVSTAMTFIRDNLSSYGGNPDKIYVLSGKPLGDDSGVEKLDNVICTGYVSDSEARALMQYCRAFLFPSTYEGFGIPPMEALCMGAPVVLGDIPVLHEIYGNAAYYVDCDNADISIEQLLKQGGREAPETVLSRYSWEKSARIMMEALTK